MFDFIFNFCKNHSSKNIRRLSRNNESKSRTSLRIDFLENREMLSSYTWIGKNSTDLWSHSANWLGNNIPSSSDTSIQIYFNSGRRDTYNDLNLNSINSIEFDNDNFNITGHTLNITSSISTTSLHNYSATIANLDFSSNNVTITGNNLTVGLLYGSPNGTLTLGSSVTIQSGNYAGTITGAGGIIKNGTSWLYLGGTNSYSGGTTVSGGFLVATKKAALPPNNYDFGKHHT